MGPGATDAEDRRSDSATRVERRQQTTGGVRFRPPTGAAPTLEMRSGAMRGTSTTRTPPTPGADWVVSRETERGARAWVCVGERLHA